MKVSLHRHRRHSKYLNINESKNDEIISSSFQNDENLSSTKSDNTDNSLLTKIEDNDKIKKVSTKVLKIDDEGNLKSSNILFKPKKKLFVMGLFDLNYLNIGFYLIVPILLGIFIGIILDSWLKTNKFFVLLFIFIGVIGSFYNLFKLTKK